MKKIFLGLTCILFIALAAAFASSYPDGLEWVAEKIGFAKEAGPPAVFTPMPNYNFLPIRSSFWSTLFAGTIGAFACYLLSALAARLFKGTKQ